MISSGILLFAAFVLLRLFTHNKPSMMAIDTVSRSRREAVIPAAIGAVIGPCALIVTEGVLVVVVGGEDGLVTVAATPVGERDGLKSVAATNVDTLVRTANNESM